MQIDKDVVTHLNRLLSFELTSIEQYMEHSRRYEDLGLNKLYERINHEVDDERGHADLLIRRILFLESKPDMETRHELRLGKTVPQMIEGDLALEREN